MNASTSEDLDYASLNRRLSSALGPHFGVATSSVNGDLQWLYPEEAKSISKAVPKRQREFAAGRRAARNAMRAIGWQDMPVPCNADRSPAWPEGLVGSISHTRQACIAIVGRKSHVKSIGVDIEEHQPIESDLWSSICTPQELDFVSQFQPMDRGLWVARIFSAKEAFYKWQYPATGHLLGFQDVSITLEESSQNFRASCPIGHSVDSSFRLALGRSYVHHRLIISIVA